MGIMKQILLHDIRMIGTVYHTTQTHTIKGYVYGVKQAWALRTGIDCFMLAGIENQIY